MTSSIAPASDNGRITACPDCDLLLEISSLGDSEVARCPRCQALLPCVGGSHDITDRSKGLAVAITGLILFVPAVTTPMLRFELVGQTGTNTLFDGIFQLWEVGFPELAVLVFLCSFLAPLSHLLLTCVAAICLRKTRLPSFFPSLIKALQFFEHWSMLEVYTLSMLVAYIKLAGDGETEILLGSYLIAGLLVVLLILPRYFHSEMAWKAWDISQKLSGNGASARSGGPL